MIKSNSLSQRTSSTGNTGSRASAGTKSSGEVNVEDILHPRLSHPPTSSVSPSDLNNDTERVSTATMGFSAPFADPHVPSNEEALDHVVGPLSGDTSSSETDSHKRLNGGKMQSHAPLDGVERSGESVDVTAAISRLKSPNGVQSSRSRPLATVNAASKAQLQHVSIWIVLICLL